MTWLNVRYAIRFLNSGNKALKQRDYQTARIHLEESLKVFREEEHWQGVFAARLGLGYLSREIQDYPTARSHFEQCISLARNLSNTGFLMASQLGLASVSCILGDVALAARLGKEALKLLEIHNDPQWTDIAYNLLGLLAANPEEARAHFLNALASSREQGEPASIIVPLCNLGYLAEPGRDNQEERAYLEECIEYCRASGEKQILSYALRNMGDIERYAGDFKRAEQLYHESLTLKQEDQNRWGMAYALESYAALALAQLQGERAARLFGAAASIRERLGTPLTSFKRERYEQNVAKARLLLDAATFEAAWEAGRALSAEEAVEYALTDC
jgi:hypothetical protein